MFEFLFIALPFAIAVLAASLVTSISFKRLKRANVKYTGLITAIIFIGSLLIFGAALFALILYNIRIER